MKENNVIETKVLEAIEEVLCCEQEITTDQKLKQDLEADSLDAIEITMALERDFCIEIEDNDIFDEQWNEKTVQDIIDFIKVKLSEK